MADLNVANDVALCRNCGLVHKFSSLVQAADLNQGVDLNCPPPGTWYRDNGLSAVVGATHRSSSAVMGLLCISLFWNGIVSVFVLFAFSATLRLLSAPIPAWLPSPKNAGNMGWGITIFLWLFLTPFIVIGLAMLVSGVAFRATMIGSFPVLSVVGFIVMFGGVVFAVTGPRVMGKDKSGPVPGASRSKKSKGSGGSFTSRMEDRFRRRFDE